ncbi:peptidoglycan-binding domain-containing protein [uncultured Pseudodesulfovibrio sp.]|uniref:peptidoglycan-binding domain-containing protein n=1 Tax=uncultured Pseudodesulfovibrio sp. TaxID=2035858 RepID=UPI0029C93CB9|nr:peptidoglycan-binding domain-containing protein [uncultured Pseudodesulfovibrio sp.]
MKIKTGLLFITLLMLLGISSGCVSSGSSTQAPETPVYQPQITGEKVLYPDEQTAVTTLALAKKGILPQDGAITMAPNATVALAQPAPGFSVTQEGVSGIRQLPDGNLAVEVLCEYQDTLGRKASMLDVATYTLRQPTGQECKTVSENMVAEYTTTMKNCTPEVQQQTMESIKDFQTSAGLKSDGILGQQTAMAMAQGMEFQEFTSLVSAPIYTTNPRFEIYFIDEVVAKNAPDTYLKGFDSLDAVRVKAIPSSQFAARAKNGGKYLALIYFMDQLPKDTPIQIGLSQFSTRKDTDRKATMQPVYSTGRDWPVIVAPFSLANTNSKLYAHVMVSGEIAGTTQLK